MHPSIFRRRQTSSRVSPKIAPAHAHSEPVPLLPTSVGPLPTAVTAEPHASLGQSPHPAGSIFCVFAASVSPPATPRSPSCSSTGFRVGNCVDTFMGPGRVHISRDVDQMCVIDLDWSLADGTSAVAVVRWKDLRALAAAFGRSSLAPPRDSLVPPRSKHGRARRASCPVLRLVREDIVDAAVDFDV